MSSVLQANATVGKHRHTALRWGEIDSPRAILDKLAKRPAAWIGRPIRVEIDNECSRL